jgi:hypothetical protein
LEEIEGRPALTFNLVKPTIDLIVGVNESNAIEMKAEPTEPDDEFLSDILNDADDKMAEIGEFDDTEDEAFEDGCTCGRGYVAMDIQPDPKRPGEIKIIEVNPAVHEIRLDPAGTKNDLSDHRHIFWDKWITVEDFAISYPEHIKDLAEILREGQLFGDLPGDDVGGSDVWSDSDQESDDSDYEVPLDFDFYDKGRDRVRIVHMEYWDTYDRYYGFNPQTGQIEEFEEKNLKILQKTLPDFEHTTIKDKKVRWLQFIGDKILYDGDSPLPFDGFSIVTCFAYKDKSRKQIEHFGVVRPMKDPQKEVNKRWSQTLNLLNKQAQGGYFREVGAEVDKAQWDDSINAPGETTLVTQGAIKEQKFREKEIPQFPVASMTMQEHSQDMMKKVTGANPDLLGLESKRDEPGIVIRLRQQQGLVLLSRLFKSNKRMKKQLAERRYAIIMKYMPDSQLQRILGQTERYMFRGGLVVDKENGLIAPLRNLRDLKYNISMQESPSNMSKMMFELSTFMEMMGKGFPVDPKTVINKLDLPASEKTKWIQYVEGQQKSQSDMMQQELMAKLQEISGKQQTEQGKLDLQAKKQASDRDRKPWRTKGIMWLTWHNSKLMNVKSFLIWWVS